MWEASPEDEEVDSEEADWRVLLMEAASAPLARVVLAAAKRVAPVMVTVRQVKPDHPLAERMGPGRGPSEPQ